MRYTNNGDITQHGHFYTFHFTYILVRQALCKGQDHASSVIVYRYTGAFNDLQHALQPAF